MKFRKTLILATLGLALAFAAGVVFAQATVSLFPNKQVSEIQRTTAVVSVCSMFGYSEDDGADPPNVTDPAIVFDAKGWVISHAWTNDAAMWQHYETWLIAEMKNERLAAWAKVETASPGDFE